MLISELAYPRRILLDTHVWVWAALGLKSKVKASVFGSIELAATDQRLFISAACVWEVALKVAKGEISLSTDMHTWLREQKQPPGIRVWPLSPEVLIDMTRLPLWRRHSDGKEHRDPNDRFLVTTARRRKATLVTCDVEIIAYAKEGHVAVFDARP